MCVFSIFPFRFLRGHIIRLANETDSIALVKLFAWNVCKMSEREWIECYKSGNESSGIIPWKMLKRVMIIRIIAWKMSKRVMKLLLARLRPSFPGTAKLSSCSCIRQCYGLRRLCIVLQVQAKKINTSDLDTKKRMPDMISQGQIRRHA